MTVQAPEKPDVDALLARLDQLRQAERRAASARMVSVIGHVIGTPLNVIAGRAALIRTNPTPEAMDENLRRIEQQVERLSMRIRRLIDYFGLAEQELQPRTVHEVLDECLSLYRPVAAQRGVSIEVSVQDVDPVQVDGAVTTLVLTTLLSLATRTTPPGQVITLTASEHGPHLMAFELGLPGLDAPPGRLDRLEPPEHGVRYDAGALETLWICLGLARRVGGSLEVTNAPSGGRGVTIRFECAHA